MSGLASDASAGGVRSSAPKPGGTSAFAARRVYNIRAAKALIRLGDHERVAASKYANHPQVKHKLARARKRAAR